MEKVPLHRLKILLQYRNEWIYVAIAILCLCLIQVSLWYGIVGVFYAIFINRNKKYLRKVILVGMLVYVLSIGLFHTKIEPFYIVTESIEKESYYVITTSSLFHKVMVYSSYDMEVGDVVLLDYEDMEIRGNTIDHTFDYKAYLWSKRVTKVGQLNSFDYLFHLPSFDAIKGNVEDYINKNMPLSKAYVKTFIMADKTDFDEAFIDDINQLGITHLFAVSGLHVGLLVSVISLGLKKANKQKYTDISISLVLFVYMIMTSFSPSIVRAGFLFIGLRLNKKFKWELSTLDILSAIFIFLLILSPYSFYNIGFSLSFLITFGILLGQYLLLNTGGISQMFRLSLLAYTLSLPLTVGLNQEMNLITVIVNVFFVYLMMFVVLPLGYMTFLLAFLDPLYASIIDIFEGIVLRFSSMDVLVFDFVFSHPLIVIMYYMFWYGFLIVPKHYLKQWAMVSMVFLLLSQHVRLFDFTKSVTMIDLYGDSILIKDAFDRCNILIDTGIDDSYDTLIHYLKGQQIKRLDYLIITHEHSDHNGERADLYQDLDIETEINRFSELTDFRCGHIDVEFLLFDVDFQEENNKSLVFLVTIEGKTYLFTGDMEEQKENILIEQYSLDVDVLKSGHHGSITSSSDAFLQSIKAEEVWISCYYRNTHGHPHDIVIERYEKYGMEIHRTDLNGTIQEVFVFGYSFKRYENP